MTVKEFYTKHDLSGYILDRIKFDTAENEILFMLSDDTDEIGRTAHIAKSTTRVMGLNDIADRMEQLQRMAENKETPDQYPALIKFYLDNIPTAIEELKAEIAKLP